MKELVCNKIEVLFIFISSMLACVLAYAMGQPLNSNKAKTITPFHMNFGNEQIEVPEADNNLSGNSGISQEYYSKQIHQFLRNKSSFE